MGGGGGPRHSLVLSGVRDLLRLARDNCQAQFSAL